MDQNPFTFGALVLDDAFTDREAELRELGADLRNGQDVVLFAPRRYGKSSLVLRAARSALRKGVLVAYCDLMKTPTKERFAAALAKTIYDDLAGPVPNALERASSLFRGLRVKPAVELGTDDASVRFTFEGGARRADVDATIERLLELPAQISADRGRRVAVVLDEFQEITALDPRFPNLMRAVFQTQPEVSHVYLGSKRHVLERIFSDRNEPFWRSAKRTEIGPIAPAKFATFIAKRFDGSEKAIRPDALDRLLAATGGHPYATQELAYFVWELVPRGHFARARDVDEALEQVVRSEHSHFTRLWDDATRNERLLLIALADEPSGHVYSDDYRERHALPAATYIQRALGALRRDDVVGRNDDGTYRLIEPFLAEWLRREQSEVRRPRGRGATRGS